MPLAKLKKSVANLGKETLRALNVRLQEETSGVAVVYLYKLLVACTADVYLIGEDGDLDVLDNAPHEIGASVLRYSRCHLLPALPGSPEASS